jgi:hypothetical protein
VPVEPAFEVEGARQIAHAFRSTAGSTKDLSAAHRKVAKVVEGGSRRGAASGRPQQRAAGRTLAARGSQASADLALRNTSAVPFGLGAFLGSHRPQFPGLPWVGNRWDILAGDGPHVIADAIRRDAEDIRQTFADEVLALLKSHGIIE